MKKNSRDQVIKQSGRLAKRYRVTDGAGFQLRDFDPADTGHLGEEDKPRARELLAQGVTALAQLQEKLYAADRWGVLLIFQAMDAAGKDSVIKHVMSGVNPQGCQVYSFKAPSSEELDHDYLWRCHRAVPERGRIGIFNRSYYEEVLAPRVQPEILERQRLPASLVARDIWIERSKDIRRFEHYLARNGVLVLKFFLHVSKAEQRRRFLERLNDPAKHWKFSSTDQSARAQWTRYQQAYADMIRRTATKHAPWHVVPADNKWFTRIAVAAAIITALDSLHLAYPPVSPAQRKEIRAARRALKKEK